MDRIRIVGGSKLNGTIADLGREERRAAADDREPADRGNARSSTTCRGLPTSRSCSASSATTASTSCRRASGPATRQYQGQTLHISAADIIDTTAPYDLVSRMRASFWVIAPLLGADARGQGLAAGRLRHRHAAGRSPDHGAGESSAPNSPSTAAM